MRGNPGNVNYRGCIEIYIAAVGGDNPMDGKNINDRENPQPNSFIMLC
jgi:hypothetical protein